jgi:cytochrome c556
MRNSSWLVVAAVALFGLTLMANEKPSDAYVKSMKDIGAAQAALRAALTAKDYDTIAKHAVTIRTSLAATQSFWTAKKADDAVASAKAGITAATDLETAAKAKNDEGIAVANRAVNASCGGCHTAHRERLADGTYEIK